MTTELTATVVVVSDSVSAGTNQDRSGKLLVDLLKSHGVTCEPIGVVPDDVSLIQNALDRAETDIIAFTGGTGVGPRDVTPEAIAPMIEKRLPGIEEAIRAYGMNKNPRAMLSRAVAGIRGKSLVLCLPGSPSGVEDAVAAVFPTVLHVFDVLENKPH
jgi:molybdenum cofactor synthesis domain-containing protein